MDERDSSENPDPLIGHYSNYFRIGFNPFEFVVDFGQHYDGAGASMHTRIVSGPVYVKALSRLLLTSIEDYERRHGSIPEESGHD